VNVQIKKHGRILAADDESLPEMLFAGRSGPRQLLFLADSGASGCILGTKTAAEIGLPITPWTHEGEGFKCANEAIMRVVGTATLPLTIQRYVGKAHVHIVDNLPEGIDVILGSDWMKRERAILDYDRMVMVVKSQKCTLTPANRMVADWPKASVWP
jgi:hypothetical protein